MGSQQPPPGNQNQLTMQSAKDLNFPLKDSIEGRNQLGLLLAQCFDTMKLYGKEPQQMKSAAALFNLVLAEYCMDEIQAAFVAYLSRNSEMPTPSDIMALIKRNGKPPLEKSIYVALAQKKERTTFTECGVTANCLTLDEEKYMAEYEAEMMGVVE